MAFKKGDIVKLKATGTELVVASIELSGSMVCVGKFDAKEVEPKDASIKPSPPAPKKIQKT